jgi:hypothetical protein
MKQSLYRISKVNTQYGNRYYIEIKILGVFWAGLSCHCSLSDAYKQIEEHANPKQPKYLYFTEHGICLNKNTKID